MRHRRHLHRFGAAVLAALVVLGAGGCGGDTNPPATEAVTANTGADATAEIGALGAVPDAGPACRTPGPLPADASDALTALHGAVADLAASAGAVRSLALEGPAPATWPGDPADSLILRRFLEDLYRTAGSAANLAADPEAAAVLADAQQSLLALQAGDLPRLYQAQSAEDSAGPVAAICATVDLFADAVDAIGASGQEP
ncbi:MAG: hypothetical protein KKE89_09110 [Actinobacteria bacterium]|nr:hypothetical protein [Actinomycetota bacterium]